METEFVPYEITLALKELGFDKPCLGFYLFEDTDHLMINGEDDMYYNPSSINLTLAPLYQQAFRWFRKKYKLEMIRISPLDVITYYIASNNIPIEQNGKIFFITGDYLEKAELECLKKLIEIVKNKQK